RFPGLRIASIESGSSWVSPLVKKLKRAYGQMPTAFGRDPVESFAEHVWVAPFYEDDLAALKEIIGIDHVLFGSDWPHAEGLADPRSFADPLRAVDYTEDEVHTVMVVNGRALTERRVLTSVCVASWRPLPPSAPTASGVIR